MARIRTIKPSFFTDAKICRLSAHARLLFIATWSIADDSDGVFDARPSILKAAAFIEDMASPDQIKDWLEEILRLGLVWIFQEQGVPYGVVRSWGRHQVISKPGKKANPGIPPEIPGDSWKAQESPGNSLLEGKGKEGKGGGGGSAPEISGAFPEAPPPPSSKGSTEQPAGPATQNRPPFVRQVWARCLETITPSGAPRELSDDTAAAIEQLIARQAGDRQEWYVSRLFELLGQIAKSDRHGPGGSFIIASPRDLLRKSHPKDPHSKLVIDEMEAKFPSGIETPERRAKRERAAWLTERTNELAAKRMVEKGTTRLSAKDEQDAKEKAEDEWEARRAGPAPPGATAPKTADQQPAKEG